MLIVCNVFSGSDQINKIPYLAKLYKVTSNILVILVMVIMVMHGPGHDSSYVENYTLAIHQMIAIEATVVFKAHHRPLTSLE